MTKKFLLLFLMSLVAGCETIGQLGGGAPPPCGSHVCKVQVTVTGTCNISVVPFDLAIAGENKNVVIQWDITDAKFPADGIFFKDDPGGEFHSFNHGNGTKFTVINRHSKVGVVYHYGVRVVQNGATCPPLDPTIMN